MTRMEAADIVGVSPEGTENKTRPRVPRLARRGQVRRPEHARRPALSQLNLPSRGTGAGMPPPPSVVPEQRRRYRAAVANRTGKRGGAPRRGFQKNPAKRPRSANRAGEVVSGRF